MPQDSAAAKQRIRSEQAVVINLLRMFTGTLIRAVNRQGEAPKHREHRAQALVQGLHRMTAMDLVSSNGDWRIRRRLDNIAQAFSNCNAQTIATGASRALAA